MKTYKIEIQNTKSNTIFATVIRKAENENAAINLINSELKKEQFFRAGKAIRCHDYPVGEECTEGTNLICICELPF